MSPHRSPKGKDGNKNMKEREFFFCNASAKTDRVGLLAAGRTWNIAWTCGLGVLNDLIYLIYEALWSFPPRLRQARAESSDENHASSNYPRLFANNATRASFDTAEAPYPGFVERKKRTARRPLYLSVTF
ncbi:hypothetical protein ACRALDRAFT_205479 [Sodiomyces alcalophilus JCM 7366]|uniref:uncharacterized protein n=1 Tax=Sodiomyces alcalophilus JCM 7366 TaxID=591952 RepID=UPI0039B529F3